MEAADTNYLAQGTGAMESGVRRLEQVKLDLRELVTGSRWWGQPSSLKISKMNRRPSCAWVSDVLTALRPPRQKNEDVQQDEG